MYIHIYSTCVFCLERGSHLNFVRPGCWIATQRSMFPRLTNGSDGRSAGHQLRFDGGQRGVRWVALLIIHISICMYIFHVYIYIYMYILNIYHIHIYIYYRDIYNKIYVLHICIYDTSIACIDSLSMVWYTVCCWCTYATPLGWNKHHIGGCWSTI